MNRSKQHGFTLVEMAMVLAIIGAIVGAIMGGLNLIKNAELRKLINTMQTYDQAVSVFYNKYKGLPGDLRNATSFFGTSMGGSCNDATIAQGKPGTCNGNGDGIIGNYDIPHNAQTNTEHIRVFEQMAQAGVIEGYYYQYTQNSGVQGYVPGLNMPNNLYGQANMGIWFDDSMYDRAATKIFLGKTCFSRVWNGAFITVDETYMTDKKIDDGKPGTGKVQSYSAQDCIGCCTTNWMVGADPNTTSYKWGQTGVACVMQYIIDEDQ